MTYDVSLFHQLFAWFLLVLAFGQIMWVIVTLVYFREYRFNQKRVERLEGFVIMQSAILMLVLGILGMAIYDGYIL